MGKRASLAGIWINQCGHLDVAHKGEPIAARTYFDSCNQCLSRVDGNNLNSYSGDRIRNLWEHNLA